MPDLSGQSLGRYHILEQLGEGGMATVYKAYDTRLERDVAVKVIRVDQFGSSVLERILKRFEREAKALARLQHPNIVGVIDYGEYEGIPYLVMPFISGGTLKHRIRQGALPWQEAIRMLTPVARALEYAHQQGVIHRDIKPSNILLTQGGEPMLSDFGVAKLFDNEETTELTGTGLGVGTPEYMAPEQTGRSIDHRVDIYALGIVLYEMVTGRRPYEADTPMAVLVKQASESLPRPSKFAHNLPNAVEKIIIKALAKKPEDRYQSMGEMAKALEGLIVVKAPPVEKKPKEFAKPSPLRQIDWKIPAVVAIVLLAVVALGILWPGRGVPSQLIPTGTSHALNTSPITVMSTFTTTAPEASTQTSALALTNTSSLTDTPVPTATALPVEIIDEKGVKMRLVPEGQFIMGQGAGGNSPSHPVILSNYYMDVYEVTNAQYAACVDAGDCSLPNDYDVNSYYYENRQYDNYPVFSVRWDQAASYCEWRGARLPTEAEWEKAARGTDERSYPWGGATASSSLLNYNLNVGYTTKVGSYENGKSPYGMYDMAGNVFEWVNDWYGEYYYQSSPIENPQGPTSGEARVMRGGSWNSGEGLVSSTIRIKEYPGTAHNLLGFRCANSVAKPSGIITLPTPSQPPASIPTIIQTNVDLPVAISDDKGVKMLLVPAGPFIMGQGDGGDSPAHTVVLSDYYMDVYEVTNGQYAACVDAGLCSAPSWSAYHTESVTNYPVTYVDWNQAKTYCEWRGARLPTEAEWEKAARGTDGRTYPWGEEIDCSKGNVRFECEGRTVPVGSYESGKSPYGMYDMAGNVWEWVNDWYDTNYYQISPAENPQGPSSGFTHVLRSGSWIYKETTFAISYFRTEIRNQWTQKNVIGFRCARDANR